MSASLIRISLAVLTFYGLLSNSNAISANAPDFKLQGQKDQISLTDYRGQIVYLDFWASWCQPCRKSFGWMNKMQSLYGKQGFKVIAINLDEEREKAEKFLTATPANFDVAFDPRGNTARAYKVRMMPSSYLIDKDGNVIHANPGFRERDEDKLETKIKSLIRQSTFASR